MGDGAIIDHELAVGVHLVTLYGDDGQGHNLTDDVTVQVMVPVPPEDLIEIEITRPRGGDVLVGEITIAGTASYDRGDIAVVEVSIDEDGWRPAEGTGAWNLRFDTTIISDGIHSLLARATTDDGYQRGTSLLMEVRNVVVPEPPSIPNVTLHFRESGIVDELLNFKAEAEDLAPWTLVWSFGDGNNARGPLVRHAYREKGSYEVTLELWLEGSEEPAAVFTATVIVKNASEVGPSLENMVLVALVAAGLIYIAGFYGGRRAFRRD
jgi:hypothetical protein